MTTTEAREAFDRLDFFPHRLDRQHHVGLHRLTIDQHGGAGVHTIAYDLHQQ